MTSPCSRSLKLFNPTCPQRIMRSQATSKVPSTPQVTPWWTNPWLHLPPPHPTRAQTAEENSILAHLALAEANRSILSQNGINHRTVLPQFTPTPIGGFPHVHMAHSAQIFDHLDNKVLLAWFQVEHPKFLVRVFDHSAKDIAEKPAIIAEHIRASIATIADYVH
jgi:hypothetical protein